MRPGEVQRMTAGTGVKHSEFNHSATEPVHLLQIWILPEKPGLQPGYEQKSFAEQLKPGKLVTAVSRGGQNGSLNINQDVSLLVGKFGAGDKAVYELKPRRHAWVHVATGKITQNGKELSAGDGAAISDEKQLEIAGKDESQVLLFDLN